MVRPGWGALLQVAEGCPGDDRGGERGVERYGMQVGSAGGREDLPGDGGGEPGVAAFGEMTEGEEGPDESRAGRPGVEGAEEGETVLCGDRGGGEEREEDSRWR